MKQVIIGVCLMLMAVTSYSQFEKKKVRWGLTTELGVGMNSIKSSHVKSIAPNYSIGVVREKQSRNPKMTQGLRLKLNVYKESFSGIPHYYLKGEELVKTSMDQKNQHLMLYFGWTPKYYLKDDWAFIQAEAGCNFILLSQYKRTFDGQSGSLPVMMPPYNFMVTRPEISIGAGVDYQLRKMVLSIVPKFTYNFTIGNLNMLPSYYSFRLETSIKF